MRNLNQSKGFTLVELLVVIAIIGVLVSMMLPGVQAAREAARKTDCVNRVRQLALATHMHHNTHRYFPPARYESRPDTDPSAQCGLETPTWLARVMPFIEQVELGSRWDFSKPWHEHEESVRNVVPDIFSALRDAVELNRLEFVACGQRSAAVVVGFPAVVQFRFEKPPRISRSPAPFAITQEIMVT